MKKLELRDVLAAMIRFIAVLLLCIVLPMSCTDSKVDNDGKNPMIQPGGNDDDDKNKDDDGDDDNQEEEEPAAGTTTETVNREFTHYVMDTYYLWNEAYRETTQNFKLNYDKFLDDVLQQMHDKGQNLKDGHMYSSGWSFYSYIDRWLSSRSTRASDDDAVVDKEWYYGFGMYCVYMQSGLNVYFVPLWVYPDSPAAKAGIKRGDLIGKVNGKAITTANMNSYVDIYYDEFSQSKTYTLTVEHSDETTEDITLSTADYYPNPVLYDVVYSIKGKAVGYVVYNSFDAAYDDEILAVFDSFKAAGVEDVIFDLRYNGGGYVRSSNIIASAMAGASCVNKAFTHYLYNAERMKNSYRITDFSDATKFPAEYFKTKYAEQYGFGNIYVIGTENTASASELLINSLRGVDRQVKVVGNENTNGKDVGMEVMQTTKVYENYRYEIAAITFQTFNAKGESDYDDGFTPDIVPDKLQATDGNYYDYESFLPDDWDTIYVYSDGTIAATDYLIDALIDIAGGTLTLDDIKRVTTTNNKAAAIGRMNDRRLLPAATRAGEGGRLMPRKDPRRNNMFKYLALDTENF